MFDCQRDTTYHLLGLTVATAIFGLFSDLSTLISCNYKQVYLDYETAGSSWRDGG